MVKAFFFKELVFKMQVTEVKQAENKFGVRFRNRQLMH